MNSNAGGEFAALGDVYPDLRREARRIARATRSRHLEDDLVQYGALGIVEARQRFDPDRGVPFGAFARCRARGAMLDGLRQELPLSRRDHEGHRELRFESLDEAAEWVGATVDPEAALVEAAQLAQVRQALQRLAEHEQVIIMAIYDFGGEGSSGAALAERQGVSRSKVSREHRRILDQLGQVLGGRHG